MTKTTSVKIVIILLLFLLSNIVSVAQAAAPSAIVTFNSIGIYWSPDGGSSSNICSVRYRQSGSPTWKDGYPLWYDARTSDYRGSLIYLPANTTYDIQLTLNSSTSATFAATTWDENFPVDPNKIHYLSANSSSTLTVSDSGTANGYALYAPEPGRNITIDVQNSQSYVVHVSASYVIIRGLNLTGGIYTVVYLGSDVHDVVIENNELSNWGTGAN